MYTKIAVPLDGSSLAEKALPYAIRLAKALDAQLLLLQVAELPPYTDGNFLLEAEIMGNTREYLEGVKTTITSPEMSPHLPEDEVEFKAVYDRADFELADIAITETADLLVMTTHGRGGLARLVLGSIAAKVIRQAAIPVILIQPTDAEEPLQESIDSLNLGRRIGPVIVTLDGTKEAETAIEPAMTLARQLATSIHLVQVINPPIPSGITTLTSTHNYNYYQQEKLFLQEKEEADHYLEDVRVRVGEKGLRCVKEVRIGYPATEISAYAKSVAAITVVMATHSRGKFGRILLGSVADEVMRHSHLPVMMVNIATHAKVQPALAIPAGH